MNNFHTHTYRCLHAYGTEQDYVDAALQKQVRQLGFSDHAPFPDHDFGLRMQYEELDDYLSAIDELSLQYSGQIRLFKGLEIEFYDRYIDYYKMLLEDKKLDYLALGAHSCFDGQGNLKNIFFAQSEEDILLYADNVCRAMATGLFRFVAHPDIFFINSMPVNHSFEQACDMIIMCAKEYHLPLEFNANGYRRQKKPYPDGLRYPYPHPMFWEKAAKEGISVIIGSDCHSPEQVCDDNMTYAFEQTKALNLNLIDSVFPDH